MYTKLGLVIDILDETRQLFWRLHLQSINVPRETNKYTMELTKVISIRPEGSSLLAQCLILVMFDDCHTPFYINVPLPSVMV